jgi:hypothetical protein
MFRALHEANIEVNAFDAAGLKTYAATAADSSMQDASARVAGAKRAKEAIQMLAEHTGGRAITDTNAPEAAAADIFRRNSAYYLLGFQSSDSKSNGFRTIEVKVNRPDVDVRTRSGYYRAKTTERARASDAAMVDRALANGVAATDVAVQVNTAILPTSGRREASVFVTVGLRQSSDFAAERVTVAVAAFDSGWNQRGRHQQSFEIPERPPDYGTALYDVHSRLLLRPGRYEIRVAAESRGRSGSVIKNIDVPNFEDTDLSLSSVLIERTPAIAIKNPSIDGIVPIVPTSLRVFGQTDRASLFVRVFQFGKKPVVPVAVTARIVDARNTVAFERTTTLTIEHFGNARNADHRVDIPLDRFAPGDYLVQVDAGAGERQASRDARFTVR